MPSLIGAVIAEKNKENEHYPFKLIAYELIREDVIRDEPDGDIVDWDTTVIATSKTVKGLVQFARLKKLDINQCAYGFYIESDEQEYVSGCGWIPTHGNIYPRTSLEELL